MKAYLLLETGHVFPGKWIGRALPVKGEVVFHTGMTGYEDVVLDGSYGGQIVTFTYPLIGNVGFPSHDEAHGNPQLAGIVVNEYAFDFSPSEGRQSLASALEHYSIPGIYGVDTRAVATVIRERGFVRGMLSSSAQRLQDVTWSEPHTLAWVKQASTNEPLTYKGKPGKPHLALIDYGHNRMILDWLRTFGCHVTIVPFSWTMEQIMLLQPDGLVLSDGPGDPKALLPYARKLRPLLESLPTFGVSLGLQVMALAFGATTERLPLGHRGHHYPVKDTAKGHVWVTSQNHSYAVTKASLDAAQWHVTHVNVHDGSVEGMRHHHLPLRGIQFDLETYPGSTETEQIFSQFLTQVNRQRKEIVHA